MKIGIAGLGLIGGSAALALTEAGHAVFGTDRAEIVEAAAARGAVRGELREYADCDVLFLATPPSAALGILSGGKFRPGQIVADFCGVKGALAAAGAACGAMYVGCHPMAGREVSGLAAAQAGLFRGASFIMTDTEGKEEAAAVVEGLARDMGFTRFVRCSSDYHDEKIAYTSQLAHVVSNAYVKSDRAAGYLGFTGGSFQDMTRIAALNEDLWTQLFFMNKRYLSGEIRELAARLAQYADALDAGDETGMRALLAEGSARKRAIKGARE